MPSAISSQFTQDVFKGVMVIAIGITTTWIVRKWMDREVARVPEASEASATATAPVVIYFGSQTGTAEAFSNELAEEVKAELGVAADVVDLEEFEEEAFLEDERRVMIFCVATYGEGDPSDNAVEFHRWLLNQNDSSLLEGRYFTVMGFGNRQYVNFNAMGKFVDDRLAKLGATRFHDRGDGDDDGDIEEDFRSWIDGGLWKKLGDVLTLCGVARLEKSEELENQELPLVVTIADKTSQLPVDPSVHGGGCNSLSKFFFNSHKATITEVRELRQQPDIEAGLSTVHVEMDIAKAIGLRYQTADNLWLLPENSSELVEHFAEKLDCFFDLDRHLTFGKAPGCTKQVVKKPFPTPMTLRRALTVFCDLVQLPPKGSLRQLILLVEDPARREALLQAVLHGDLIKSLTQLRVSLREFWELFLESPRVEVGKFLQLCCRQKSRPYTISSSSREHPKAISVTVGLVQETLPVLPISAWVAQGLVSPEAVTAERAFRGCTSSWCCERLQAGRQVLVSVQSSSFRLPRSEVPVIMIAAGTGLAPFRGFWREYRHRERKGELVLFFGCTHPEKDFIYQDEIEAAVADGVITQYVPAYSRLQSTKVYVQHKVAEMQAELRAWLDKGAYIFICGSTAMGNAVVNEISKIADVTSLHNQKRLVEELW